MISSKVYLTRIRKGEIEVVEPVLEENGIREKKLKRQKVVKKPVAKAVPVAERLGKTGETRELALAVRESEEVEGLEELEEPGR